MVGANLLGNFAPDPNVPGTSLNLLPYDIREKSARTLLDGLNAISVYGQDGIRKGFGFLLIADHCRLPRKSVSITITTTTHPDLAF